MIEDVAIAIRSLAIWLYNSCDYSYALLQSLRRDFKIKQNLVCLIHSLRKVPSGQSMECATNPYFVAQSIDRYFAQDNPWIAQIHTLRITYILSRRGGR